MKNLELPETIDQAMAATGQELIKIKCTACHKPMKKFIAGLCTIMLAVTIIAPTVANAGMGEKFKEGLKKAIRSPKQGTDNMSEEYENSEFKPLGGY